MKHQHEIKPIPPGEMLAKEFMAPLKLSRADVARELGVPANRITQIIQGRRAISPDTALRLEALFDWPAVYWLQNQAEHNLDQTRRENGSRLKKEVHSVYRSRKK